MHMNMVYHLHLIHFICQTGSIGGDVFRSLIATKLDASSIVMSMMQMLPS